MGDAEATCRGFSYFRVGRGAILTRCVVSESVAIAIQCVRAVRACGDVNVARGEEGRRLDAVRLLALGFGVWINVRPMGDEIVAFEQFRHPRK